LVFRFDILYLFKKKHTIFQEIVGLIMLFNFVQL
jgi:hypothetical protein